MKMGIESWIQRKNAISRRRFLEFQSDALNILSAERLSFSLNDLREMAARRIQAAWRGYVARRKFVEIRYGCRREKAAVTIQRKVRRWLHTRAERQECKPYCPVNRLSEERLQQLQMEVNRWRSNHQDSKFPGMNQMLGLHLQVQSRLASFYCHVSEGRRRQLRQEATCAQIDALSLLMNEMPTLSQNGDLDVNWYKRPSLPFAAAARLAHRQQLQSLNPFWWQKLKL